MNWRGKHVWIIGASAGIGAALAEKLASMGVLVAASARNEVALRELILKFPGVGHMALPLDVTNAEALNAAAQTLRKAWPRIDMVIYNAGTYKQISVRTFDLQAINSMIDINLRGAFNMLGAMLPIFKSQGNGHLALVASVAGFRGLPNALGYGASKAALINLAESLKPELAGMQVKVQVVNPGFVKTRLVEDNTFPMPFIISPAQAADAMIKGFESSGFEIHFPKRFTVLLKFLDCLPNTLYFAIMKHLV